MIRTLIRSVSGNHSIGRQSIGESVFNIDAGIASLEIGDDLVQRLTTGLVEAVSEFHRGGSVGRTNADKKGECGGDSALMTRNCHTLRAHRNQMIKVELRRKPYATPPGNLIARFDGRLRFSEQVASVRF